MTIHGKNSVAQNVAEDGEKFLALFVVVKVCLEDVLDVRWARNCDNAIPRDNKIKRLLFLQREKKKKKLNTNIVNH